MTLQIVCRNCLEEDHVFSHDLNGRCDRCSGTDWLQVNFIDLRLTEESLDHFLRNKNTTMWMDWNITAADEFEQAKQFILKMLFDLQKVSYPVGK